MTTNFNNIIVKPLKLISCYRSNLSLLFVLGCNSFKKKKLTFSDKNSWKICSLLRSENQNLTWDSRWKQSRQSAKFQMIFDCYQLRWNLASSFFALVLINQVEFLVLVRRRLKLIAQRLNGFSCILQVRHIFGRTNDCSVDCGCTLNTAVTDFRLMKLTLSTLVYVWFIFMAIHCRSLQLEEERIKVLSEELKIKKSLLEDAETNYHRRLDEEVKR